ncbi:MAG: rhodanese-like domain-containing protein [Sulfurospirillaceae bacterium]|nr:rhodanese-like domain-containing protein [Sulfurospirillaceae bacterium]
MKKFFSILVFVAMTVIPSFALSVPSNHVVSASWLSKNAKHVVIVDVGSPKEFAAGHIPGAVNMPKENFFKGHSGDIKALLDTPAEVEQLFSDAGISNHSVVVFVSHVLKPQKYTDMTRGFWTAWVYGMRKVAILDGGIEAWVASGNKLSKVATAVKKGNFKVKSFSEADVKSLVDIKSALINKKSQLVDAREEAHYVGKDKDKRLVRHGHIEGAKRVSAYYFTKKEGKLYKLVSSAEAKSIFTKAGVSLHKPIITYCNTGHLATGTWFAAKFLAGVKHVGDFDGSMYQYSRTNLPVAK